MRWLDFLVAAGQSVWQVLPLGIPCNGYSPYQCLSAYALNPALLPEAGHGPADTGGEHFSEWKRRQAHWLEDFAAFILIRRLQAGRPWHEWPEPWRDRHAQVLASLRDEYADELDLICHEQFRASQAWQAVREAAHERGIYLFGDMPIFVAHDSADVWSCPDRYLVDESGRLQFVTGVPPDYFSSTGQRWGNPHYNWEYMEEEGFSWWLERLGAHFEWFDLVRIDHFRGLESVWMIDPGCETAVDGHWASTPGDELLSALQGQLGELPLVAEDLGIITPEVTALRRKFKLPGMAILQFSFDNFDDNPHKPQNITPDTVVYTGTHDNDTTRGWFDALPAEQQQHVLAVLGAGDPGDVVNAMMTTAMQSRAQLCIIPLQDVLGLGTEARMNTPGDADGHWQWRFDWSMIGDAVAPELKEMSCNAGRC